MTPQIFRLFVFLLRLLKYELGWKWHVESFANIMTFGRTIEGVTRREGLAPFLGPNGEEAVIPFIATYAFGKPRVPNQPYDGGSVFSVDGVELPQKRM